jgi:hypothetical protein
MPKLRTIGVHNCFLMNFGDTQALLGTINTLNDGRHKLGHPHIAVDFTPFYYRGPGWKHDGSGHVTQGHFGEYGLIPEEWDWLYTEKAIGAQLFAIEDLCHKGGQDLFTPGKGFRSFLDRLPLRPYQLHSILDSIARIRDLKEKKHYSEISLLLPKHGSGVQAANGSDKPDISPEMLYAMQITVYSSFMVACNGVAMKKTDINNMLTVRGNFQLEHCYSCDMRLPACFFLADQIRRAANHVLCHGCQLGQALQAHAYRLNMQRREVAEAMYRCKEHKLDLVFVLRRNSKSANPKKPDWLPHQETWPPKGVKFSGRGSVHSVAWLRARALWLKFTETLPKILEGERMNIRRLEEMIESNESPDTNHAISCGEKTPECSKEDSEREVCAIEFALGISQRNRCGGLSTENRTCRSWEHAIKEYRAAVALDRDSGYTTHSMAIRFGKNGITSFSALLGHHGNLPYFALEAPVKEADYDQEDAWMREYRDNHDDSANALALKNATIADLIDVIALPPGFSRQTTSSDLIHLTCPTGSGPATTPDVLPGPLSANEVTTSSPWRHDDNLPTQQSSEETTSSSPIPSPRATSPIPNTTPEDPSGPSGASEAISTSPQRHADKAPRKRNRWRKKGRTHPPKDNSNDSQLAPRSEGDGPSSTKSTLSYNRAARQRGSNTSDTTNSSGSGKPKHNKKPSNAPKTQKNTANAKQRGSSAPPNNRAPKAKAVESQRQETQKKPVWLPPHLRPSPQAKAKAPSSAQTGKEPQRGRWVSRLTTSVAANGAKS